jgi:hypothetical protein
MGRLRTIGFVCAAAVAAWLVLRGSAQAGLSSSYMVPLDHEAILYAKAPVDDPVARLQRRLDAGEAKLQYEDEFGYLRSLLRELKIPQSSQVLVFSKTSFQAPRIAPRTPRALYFNDSATVGFVRTGEVLELAVQDPRQGTIFYTLDQERSTRPHFDRRDICLQCHQSGATLGVPGMVVRSVVPDRTGMPLMSLGGYITDHRSALKDRWGGWYVTGDSGGQEHMGNAVVRSAAEDDRLPVSAGTRNLSSLSRFLDTGAYLTPHSDIVALMTLEHETQMNNLFTRVGWEARMAMYENNAINKSLGEPETQLRESTRHRIDAAVDEMLEYILFSGEAKLTEPIRGTSGFAAEFEKGGRRDAKGRSLRQFDLKTRMFRYPCSFMIESEAFDGLPAVVKERLFEKMWTVLNGGGGPKFAHLSSADRRDILEILAARRDVPQVWQNAATKKM